MAYYRFLNSNESLFKYSNFESKCWRESNSSDSDRAIGRERCYSDSDEKN